MSLVVKNAIRELAKSKDMRVSAETFDALDKVAEDLIKKAMDRAVANGRKTLKAADL